MVRKRTRTSRKHYDSDDNDSDSDFALEDPRSQPAPKKYSLRQRKKALFIDDYDYEDDDEILPIPPTKGPSDDEDFEVEKELTLDEGPNTHTSFSNHYEDPTEDPNGLIDFEDMIRADIVVNKNRIDYDNMIDKTEIKIQAITEAPAPVPVRSKRGRKPKKRPENEVDSSLLEPETDVQEEYENRTDGDYNPDEDTDAQTEIIQSTVSDSEKNVQEKSCEKQSDDIEKLTNTNNVNSETQESVIKLNENYVQKSLHLNGSISPAESKEDAFKKSLEDEEDDDVVFVEDKRSEIIVLDD